MTTQWVKSLLGLTVLLLLTGCAGRAPEKTIVDPLSQQLKQWQEQIDRGNRAMQNRDFQAAIEAYQAALEIKPSESGPQRKIAEIYFQLQEYSKAQSAFAAYLKLDPKNTNVRNYLGYIYEEKLKNYEAAAQQYEKALETDPRNLYTLIHLGLVYGQLRRLDEAEQVLRKALVIDPQAVRPESKNLYNYFGLILLGRGEVDKAIAAFQQSRRLFPNSTWAQRQIETIQFNPDETLPSRERVTPRQILGVEILPIATVNGVDVSRQRFNKLYEAQASPVRQLRGEIHQTNALNFKAAIASQLIDELLLQQVAEQRNIKVTEVDVDVAMKQFAASFPNQKQFQTYVAASNGGAVVRERLRLRLVKERLTGLELNSPVSDEEALAFYKQHTANFNIPAHLNVQDCVFWVDLKASEEGAQKAKALEILKLLRSGATFTAVVQKHSEGPTARWGGYLGRVTKTSIDPKLWTALSKMKPDEVSDVIRSDDGYHVVKLVSRHTAQRLSFEEVKARIKKTIQLQRWAGEVASLMTTQRAKATIENHLYKRYFQGGGTSLLTAREVPLEGGISTPGTLPEGLSIGPAPATISPTTTPERE